MMMQQPGKFAFVDEGEAIRKLGVDRDTLLTLVREGRLRAYPGVGKGHFFKTKDIEDLLTELHAGGIAEPASGAEPPAGRKLFDPAYKVHVRLQADLKWYDLEDEDFQAWVRELHPDGYQRQRTNITNVIAKLERLVALMDEAASTWQNLKSPAGPPTPAREKRTAGKPLPMAGGAATGGTTPVMPSPRPGRAAGKPLPLATPQPPAATEDGQK